MKSSESNSIRPDNDLLDEVFRHATARARPPRDAELAARAALRAEWVAMTARGKRRRRYWPLAAAASLVLAAGVAALLLRGPASVTPPRTVAAVEVVVGTVQRQAPDEPGRVSLAAGWPVQTGQRISTQPASGLAVRWLDGSSVRLDENSDVELTAAGVIRLVSGRVYVDAGEGTPTAEAVIIETPAGRVRHVGTQYMTAVGAAGTTVSVRRGKVRVDGPGSSTAASAGEQLQVDAASGSASRQAITAYGDVWQWTQATAPAFAADGRSVADFLDWVSRESGRAISYASPAARQLAQRTELHGRIDLEPMRALAAILQTSDLAYEVRDGSLLIRPAGGG